MTHNKDKNNNTPLPATANDPADTGKTPGDARNGGDKSHDKAAKPEAAPTEATPTEKPKMDPGSKPAVSEPAQHKNG